MSYVPTKQDKKLFKGMSVCILTPCSSYHVHTKFTKCVVDMVAYSWMHGLEVQQIGITERMVVDWARNDLARRARDHISIHTGKPFTHYLWLDDDHVFGPDLAVYLAKHNLDMVSALYYSRVEPHYPVVYVKSFDEDSKDDKYKHYPLVEVPDTLFECEAIGFGALMMRAEVLRKVPEPWFTLDWRAGEDIAFCVKAREHGVRIYCDARYKLGHIGVAPIITHSTYLDAKKRRPDIFEQGKIKVELKG